MVSLEAASRSVVVLPMSLLNPIADTIEPLIVPRAVDLLTIILSPGGETPCDLTLTRQIHIAFLRLNQIGGVACANPPEYTKAGIA